MEEKPPIFEYIFSRVLICKTTSDNLEREKVYSMYVLTGRYLSMEEMSQSVL